MAKDVLTGLVAAEAKAAAVEAAPLLGEKGVSVTRLLEAMGMAMHDDLQALHNRFGNELPRLDMIVRLVPAGSEVGVGAEGS